MYDTELVKEILHQLDAEIVYSVCENQIEELGRTIQRMLTELEES